MAIAEQSHPPLRPGLALRRNLAGTPIVYDDPSSRRQPQLQARDMEILRALWRYTYLTTSQVAETWWPGRHPSRSQIRLAELAGAGLLARFRPLVKRGTHQWIYQLARKGFRAGQTTYGTDGTYVDEDARWSERRAADMSSVEQVLRVNGWMLAYRLLLGERLLDWRGARDARATAPAGTGQAADVSPDAAALIDLERTPPRWSCWSSSPATSDRSASPSACAATTRCSATAGARCRASSTRAALRRWSSWRAATGTWTACCARPTARPARPPAAA